MLDVRVKQGEAVVIEECGEDLVEVDGDFVLDCKYFEWGYKRTPEMSFRKSCDSRRRCPA